MKNMLPELVIFDMDGTLTESKSTADAEMIELVKKLLEKTKIAVISGGGFSRFHEQFLVSFLIDVSGFDNLYLAALNGGTLYSYHIADWKKVYEDVLSEEEIKKYTTRLKPHSPKSDLYRMKKYTAH